MLLIAAILNECEMVFHGFDLHFLLVGDLLVPFHIINDYSYIIFGEISIQSL